MRKLGAAVWMFLVLAAAAGLGGCATSSGGSVKGPPEPGSRAARAESQDAAQPAEAAAPRDTGPGVGDYVAVVPENVVWIPWKMVGGALKGLGDGVGAGFEKGRMPLLGAIFSPINAVTGFVTGFFEGAAMSPGVIGPTDRFGRTMSLPMKRSTTVWWYP